MEQISVLKASLGLSEEDLQWKVESAKGNAFLAAERRLGESEERYDRLDYEIQLLSQTPCEEVSVVLLKKLRELIQQSQTIAELKPKLVECQNEIAQTKKDLMDARVQVELQLATAEVVTAESNAVVLQLKRVEDANAALLATQEQLKIDLSRLNDMLLNLTTETENLDRACADFKFMSPQAAGVSSNLIGVLKRIPECSSGGDKLVALCEQAVQTAQKLKGSRAKDLKAKQLELDQTMKDIEIWKSRREQAKEFALEMAKREQRWKEDNLDDNLACVRLLRGLIPVDVNQLTVEAIIEQAQQVGGVLFTYDLATYIKTNKFLHWLVTHESDIARDNFLAVESASFFMNFVSYDIVELRALARVLPDTFEFDKDGKKAGWKSQFLEHVFTLVKQQRGETIKTGWDPTKRARAEVPLMPLSDRQTLNPVYRYPTDEEIKTRIDKFELQNKRLKQKQEKLKELDDDLIPAAKAEYLAIAEDARSEELQKTFGKPAIIKLREDAKQQYNALCKSRDTLRSEIRHAENAWKALSPSYEQYLVEVEKIRQLDPVTRSARVCGPFPADTEIKPRERAVFKKLSVEEEAQARKMELESAIAQRSQDIAECDSAPAAGGESRAASVSMGNGRSLSFRSTSVDIAGATSQDAAVAIEVDGENGGHLTDAAPAKDGDTSDPVQQQTPHKFQKVKSLRVAANVLRFLEQDFCSPTRLRTTSSPVQSGEVSTPRSRARAAEADQQEVSAPPVPTPKTPCHTRPKSKALLRLLEKATADKTDHPTGSSAASVARPASPLAVGRPNFLGELQKRVGAKKVVEGSEDTETKQVDTPPTQLLSPHPLNPGASSYPAKSFLDELKAKAKPKSTDRTEEQASSPHPPPLSMPPSTTTSQGFLAELKARAKATANE